MDSLRIGLLTKGCAVTLFAASAACSSPSANPIGGVGTSSGGSSSGSGSGSSSGGSGAHPVLNGTGMACTDLMGMQTFSFATTLTLNVSWPPALAIQGCSASDSPPCKYVIHLLTTYSANGMDLTSTTKTCGSQTPATTYNAVGNIAAGVPAGQIGKVLVEIPAATWDQPHMPISMGTAHLGGWNVGSSITSDPSTSLVGFNPGNALLDPTKPWPAKASDLNSADFFDSDGDGHPGLSVFPRGDPPYYLPHNSTDSTSAALDAFYVVTRTTIDLYGTSQSCNEYKGTANVSQLQTHIVGCRQKANQMDCTTTDPNTGSLFIDSNNTIFHADSGTFDSVKVPTQSATALKCSDVASMFP